MHVVSQEYTLLASKAITQANIVFAHYITIIHVVRSKLNTRPGSYVLVTCAMTKRSGRSRTYVY